MKVRVTVSIDYEVLKMIQMMADEADRSVSSYINLILRKAMLPKK